VIVVSDTSPIINLAAVHQLSLLRSLYTEITIPEGVYNEIALAGSGLAGADEVRTSNWFKTLKVREQTLLKELEIHLDSGEAETIALGSQLKADLLLLDERRARKVAADLGLRHIGVVGVLIEAKSRGYLAKVKPILDAMISEAGFWISSELYARVMQAANE
jgi:predicted nucleic acid-binding protein